MVNFNNMPFTTMTNIECDKFIIRMKEQKYRLSELAAFKDGNNFMDYYIFKKSKNYFIYADDCHEKFKQYIKEIIFERSANKRSEIINKYMED